MRFVPLSAILVAGLENSGERREVIRNNRKRLFFFCGDENSPSMSARARPRFSTRGWRGAGWKMSGMVFLEAGGVGKEKMGPVLNRFVRGSVAQGLLV